MTKKEYISKKIKKLMDEGYSQDQAVAISYSMYNNKYALGGYNERDPEESEIRNYAMNHNISFNRAKYILEGQEQNSDEFNTIPNYNSTYLLPNGNLVGVPGQTQGKFNDYNPFSVPSTGKSMDTSSLPDIKLPTPEQNTQSPTTTPEVTPEPAAPKTTVTEAKTNNVVNETEGTNNGQPAYYKKPNEEYDATKDKEDKKFNPYGGIDLETAASLFGSSLKSDNTGMGILSGLKLAAGIGRNIVSGIGNANRNQYVREEAKENKRDYLHERADGGVHRGFETGGSYNGRENKKTTLPPSKVLTGEFLEGVGKNSSIKPNAELEEGEYVLNPKGEYTKIVGNTHKQGGEDVKLKEGDMIISNKLKVGGKTAKKLRKMFDVKVKAKDTYADVIDKLKKSRGITKLTKKEEDILQKINNQIKDTEDDKTRSLNLQFLYNKRKDIVDKKEDINSGLVKDIKTVFNLQEVSKERDIIKNLAKDSGITEEDARDALLKKYEDGGTIPGTYEDWMKELKDLGYDGPTEFNSENRKLAQEWVASKFPTYTFGRYSSGSNRIPIQNQQLTTIVEKNPDILESVGINSDINLANLSDKQRFAIFDEALKTMGEGKLKNLVLQNHDDGLTEYRFVVPPKLIEMYDEYQNDVSEDPELSNAIRSSEKDDADTTESKNTDGEKETNLDGFNIPMLPTRNFLFPDHVSAQTKISRNYDRIEADLISPEQQIQQNMAAAEAAELATRNLPDSQRAAVISQIAANTQKANAKAIANAENINTQIKNKTRANNAKIQMREEDAAAEDMLSFERRQQTAEAITKEQLKNFYEALNAEQQQNYRDINNMNLANAAYDNYDVDSNGNIIYKNNISGEDRKEYLMNLLMAQNAIIEANKEEKK